MIIDDGYDHYEVERSILAGVGAELALTPCRGNAEAVVDAISDADAVMVRESPITAEAIARAGRLRGIVRYGIGVDNIDRAEATKRKIFVANVPDYGTEDVSDHAMALLLAVARRIVTRDVYVRQGGWFSGSREKIHRLSGKTLGLIGYGRIARAFERKMRGFGIARVLVFDPRAQLPANAEVASVDEICRDADYISLHAPLNADTKHVIDARRLAMCKPTAIIINTARGPLIDETALIAALKSGQIMGAGLDVFEQEPPLAENQLLRLSNVVLSDHAGWYSEESVVDLQRKAAEEVARILSGQPPVNWLNRWSNGG